MFVLGADEKVDDSSRPKNPDVMVGQTLGRYLGEILGEILESDWTAKAWDTSHCNMRRAEVHTKLQRRRRGYRGCDR